MQGKQDTARKRVPLWIVAPTLSLALLSLAFLSLWATPALAGKTHVPKIAFGTFSDPSGIVVDQTNDNVFVTDGASSGSVEIFGPEGGVPTGVTTTKIEGFDFENGPPGLAIDESPTSPSKGAFYVTDVEHNTVKKFILDGGEYKEAGTLNASPTASPLVRPRGVAVDAKGNVFVANEGGFEQPGSRTIVEFSPAGNEITRIDVGSTVRRPAGLSFDSAGDLFVQSFLNDGFGVWELEANGSGEMEPAVQPIQVTTGSPTGIAIDQATNTLYIAEKNHIDQYSTSCTPVAVPNGQSCTPELQFGFGTLTATQRLAVAANGDIYVVDRGNKDVVVFAAALSIVPDPETASASAVRQTAATLNGTVSAAEGPPASCEFEYASEADFKAEGFAGAASAPCVPAGPFSGSVKEAVKGDVAGLDPETLYRFRLVASNENGPAFGEVLSFATVGKPKIDATTVAGVTFTGATLEGLINPNGGPSAAVQTSYFFEYASSASYTDAIQVPLGGGTIGSGTEDVKVTQQISGLRADSTYHFRIVAENEAGQEVGLDRIFRTYAEAPAGLPDGRAYEQVSPVDKNGGEPRGAMGVVQASLAGDGIVYFSKSGIPGSEGAQAFPFYLSSRDSDWTTQGLLPPASGGASAAMRGWSEDLRQTYVSQSPLPGITTPARILERDNVTRSLRTMAEGAETAESFRYVGASRGGGVVAFESDTVLSPAGGRANAPNLYAWDKASGELSLAGIFNNGTKPAKGSLAGSNQPNSREHYTQAQHTLAKDGTAVYFTEVATGQLYLRRNPTREQSPLAAGKCTDPQLACTLQLSLSQRTFAPLKDEKPATFQGATPDGSKAFFTSPANLTNDANTGSADQGNDLYRYDVSTGVLADLTPDAIDANGAEVRGVLGIADDGSDLYFVANGVLAEGAAPGTCTQASSEVAGAGQCNLYLSHDGIVSFIARLNETAPGYNASDSTNWVSAPRRGGTKVENTARVSADGETLLFRSQEQLTDYENSGAPEFYRYDAGAGKIDCVSCNPTGATPLGAATLRSNEALLAGEGANTLNRNLSADGQRVFFESIDKLVAADTNGEGGCPLSVVGGGIHTCQDVYEWEAKGSGSCTSESENGGCLYLISSGTGTEPAFLADADLTGDSIFFFTDQQLVGQDKDQITDIYDARVNGGIASQNPLPQPTPCQSSDACLGSAPPPPASESPGSSSFSAPGSPPKCKKGQVRKAGKCVKKGKPRKHKHHKKKRHSAGKRG